MGNPAIFPLIYNCRSADMVMVHINPVEREELPTNARNILNRINEIRFNSSLMREFRAIQFVTDLIDDGHVKNGHLKKMLIHSIEAQVVMCGPRRLEQAQPGLGLSNLPARHRPRTEEA